MRRLERNHYLSGSPPVRFLSVAVALLLIAACSGSGGTDDTPADGTAATTAPGTETTQAGGEEPGGGDASGGEVIYAFPTEEDGDFTTLDPNIGSVATYANSISTAVFDPLVFQDPDTNEIVGGLAESWAVSEDGLTWTIELKSGVTFHDGSPLTAEDVKYTIDRIFDEQYTLRSNLVRALGENIESVDVIDDLTVQINMSAPQANFLSSVLGRSYYSIVPKNTVEEMGYEAFAEHPIGTGPYKFVEHVRGSHILLEKNPDYTWGPSFTETAGGPPRVDQLRFVYISEPTTRLAALLAGEVDVIDGVPPVDQERLANDAEYSMVEVLKNGSSASLEFNLRWGPTQDHAVREAIASAIDRDALNAAVLAGTATPNRTFVEPRMLFRNEDATAPDYDPDRARQLLDEAGWVEGEDGVRAKDGEPLELIGLVYSDNARVMEFIQAQLAEVGISIVVTPASRAAADDLTEGGPPEGWNLFHGNPRGWTNEDPNILRTQFHSSLIPPDGTSNRPGINIPELDQLLDDGLAAQDPDERKDLYFQAQELIAEELPLMPMLSVPVSYASRSYVHGIIPDARGTYRYFHDLSTDE